MGGVDLHLVWPSNDSFGPVSMLNPPRQPNSPFLVMQGGLWSRKMKIEQGDEKPIHPARVYCPSIPKRGDVWLTPALDLLTSLKCMLLH